MVHLYLSPVSCFLKQADATKHTHTHLMFTVNKQKVFQSVIHVPEKKEHPQ